MTHDKAEVVLEAYKYGSNALSFPHQTIVSTHSKHSFFVSIKQELNLCLPFIHTKIYLSNDPKFDIYAPAHRHTPRKRGPQGGATTQAVLPNASPPPTPCPLKDSTQSTTKPAGAYKSTQHVAVAFWLR